MAFNIFGKKKKETKQPEESAPVSVPEETKSVAPQGVSHGAHAVIESFYMSEKANRLMGTNQYTFKVAPGASAPEIAKHVGALYKVQIKKVQVLNMPEKLRNVGRHHGTKPGFKKAIVTLTKGQVIEQAKP